MIYAKIIGLYWKKGTISFVNGKKVNDNLHRLNMTLLSKTNNNEDLIFVVDICKFVLQKFKLTALNESIFKSIQKNLDEQEFTFIDKSDSSSEEHHFEGFYEYQELASQYDTNLDELLNLIS